jgi:hypothetical protein
VDYVGNVQKHINADNFLQKLNLAIKSRRHKGKMRSIFSTLPTVRQVRAFATLWQAEFSAAKQRKTFMCSKS